MALDIEQILMPSRRKGDPGYGKITLGEAFYALRLLWWILGVGFVMFGFDFKTPARHFKEIEAKADTVATKFDRRITVVEEQHTAIERYLNALTLAQCIDRPRRELLMMGLPCDSLLQAVRPPQK